MNVTATSRAHVTYRDMRSQNNFTLKMRRLYMTTADIRQLKITFQLRRMKKWRHNLRDENKNV